MAQGDFTRAEAKIVKDIVSELFDAIPKTRRFNYLGHLNDVLLFLEACGRQIPEPEPDLAGPNGPGSDPDPVAGD